MKERQGRVKVSSDGSFLPFPGLTFICFLCEDVRRGVGVATSECCAIVWKSFVLLPEKSLHCTLKNHTVEFDLTQSTWRQGVRAVVLADAIKGQVWQQRPLMKLATKRDFFPAAQWKWGQQLPSVLRVEVEWANEELEKRVGQIREQLIMLGSQTPYPLHPNDYHITLAYQFSAPANQEEGEELSKELQLLKERILKAFGTEPFEVRQVQMCFFPDMTTFIPVDEITETAEQNVSI